MNQEACEPVAAKADSLTEAKELATLEDGPGQGMAPEAPGEEAAKVHVLLVEDEALIAEIIGEALTDAGHAVHSVNNAEDALAHILGGSQVDILFTDINLPGDMDGAALAENARKVHSRLAVIYASGRWGRLEQLRSFPNAAILQKPYSPARACETVVSLAAALVEADGEREKKPAEVLVLAL